jgi:hypothetical protein
LHRSSGTEANEAVDLFESLTDSDQAAVIGFLLSLRLPEESTFASGRKSRWFLR